MRERVVRSGVTGMTAVAVALCLSGCGGLTAPLPTEDFSVEVNVTGGFAGVSFSFEVSGAEGVVRGLSCESVCDYVAGEILATLSTAQIQRTSEELLAAGILQLDGIDFGTQCCDQFSYVITYEAGERISTVRGDSGTLPPLLLRAIDTLLGMVNGRLPIIVALEADPDAFPNDPLFVDDAQVVGQSLEASVSYGGGCASHEIDLVAFGGWLESFPVQVNVFLSHEDNGDPCDAQLSEVRTFDLRPLAEAYRSAYGPGDPGETVVVLRLRDPTQSGGVRVIEYRF